jgi:A/G-specific adenine glycosylase
VNHVYSHLRVTLNVYLCRLIAGTPEPRAHTKLCWINAKDFGKYPFPKANHKFLHLLREE